MTFGAMIRFVSAMSGKGRVGMKCRGPWAMRWGKCESSESFYDYTTFNSRFIIRGPFSLASLRDINVFIARYVLSWEMRWGSRFEAAHELNLLVAWGKENESGNAISCENFFSFSSIFISFHCRRREKPNHNNRRVKSVGGELGWFELFHLFIIALKIPFHSEALLPLPHARAEAILIEAFW